MNRLSVPHAKPWHRQCLAGGEIFLDLGIFACTGEGTQVYTHNSCVLHGHLTTAAEAIFSAPAL